MAIAPRAKSIQSHIGAIISPPRVPVNRVPVYKILKGNALKQFKEEFQLESDFIIIKLDQRHRLASYIVDATMHLNAEYEKILKYYNMNV